MRLSSGSHSNIAFSCCDAILVSDILGRLRTDCCQKNKRAQGWKRLLGNNSLGTVCYFTIHALTRSPLPTISPPVSTLHLQEQPGSLCQPHSSCPSKASPPSDVQPCSSLRGCPIPARNAIKQHSNNDYRNQCGTVPTTRTTTRCSNRCDPLCARARCCGLAS